MDQSYVEYEFKTSPLQPATDILIAELADLGFDSFVETPEGVKAYVIKELENEKSVKSLSILHQEGFNISYKTSEIKQQNWNAEWEHNFDPIVLGDRCTVRAPFHEVPATTYDIVIMPKMSFGTGHHETTYMMLDLLLNTDLKGKTLLDMGSGTGVLAILAAKKGALSIDAIDIDNWSYQNALENTLENNCTNIKVMEGDISLLKDQHYDIILANINRNILLEDIKVYATHLNAGGSLFLSGFYLEDLPLITAECAENSLKFEQNLQKNNWVAAKYVF
ncbi:MAG: 50S ribosomal protein L11 methyltransferase [Eudoraea sp.]|uniref:50S ribosomal protein L11 methyltransferase n=1 Tax=Eudoraea sp. TaxID=1979955 RepID=UPI003C74E55F